MKLGATDITAAYLGSTPITAAYLGDEQVWSATEPLLEEFWRDPVVAATTVDDPAYYDWETGTTSPQTVNLERGQLADPLSHAHCPQAVIDGWANRVEITTAQDPNTVINANPQGSVFVLKAGTHQDRQVTALRPGDILVGEPGAVLDGTGLSGTSAASCRAIYTETGQGTIVYNVVIQNYPLYDDGTITPPGEAVMVRGGRILNCEVNDCGNIGIKMEGPDTIVRWCVVRRAGRLAYAGGTWWETYPHPDLKGYRLEYCESDTAHVDDAFDQTWEACHKWVHVTGMKVRFNYFHGFRGYGIWFDGTAHDALIEHNVCIGGERSGIHYELGHYGIIRHNTIEGCGGSGGIFISNSLSCEVHGNYLRWNNSGLWVTDDGSHSPPGRNNTLHHNVVYQQLIASGAGNWPNGKASVHYGNSTDGHLPAVTGNVWHDNAYHIDDGAAGANLDSTELFMWLPENKSGDAGEMNFASWSALAGEVGSTIEYAEKPTGEPSYADWLKSLNPVEFFRMADAGTTMTGEMGAVSGTHGAASLAAAPIPTAAGAHQYNAAHHSTFLSPAALEAEEFTTALWVKVAGAAPVNTSIFNGFNDGGFIRGHQLWFGHVRQPAAYMGNGSAPINVSNTDVTIGNDVATRLVLVRGGGITRLYVNGVQAVTNSSTYVPCEAGATWEIGSENGSAYFTGLVWDVAFFDYAWDAATVEEDYERGTEGMA